MSLEYAAERARECRTFGESLVACASAARLELDKQLTLPLGIDPASWSRWKSGAEGIRECRLGQVQAWCGNAIPTLYLVERAGFDSTSLRVRETELERQLREVREENDALRRLLTRGLSDR